MSRSGSSRREPAKPEDTDAYLATLPADCRQALQAIRAVIRAAVPDAQEALVYGVPGFKVGGRSLVCYAGFPTHCGFYPMSPDVIRAHAGELKDYDTSEGTIRFQVVKPLPAGLVKKLVKARYAELRRR
jgi:uncharacterized protein YdhG (YjbR/CyaY superfamily)